MRGRLIVSKINIWNVTYHVNGNAALENFPFFPGVTKAIKVLENSVWRGILDKMLSDRIVRCIISTLPVYYLMVPGMLLCRTWGYCIVTGALLLLLGNLIT